MLRKLYDLIFGQNEFEKTKFEVRFELINSFLNKIQINNVEDFELLESIIYKLKDLLRLKSSNLNKAIRDSSNPLRKKEVLKIVEFLNDLKYSFLKTVFKEFSSISNVPQQASSESSSEISIQNSEETSLKQNNENKKGVTENNMKNKENLEVNSFELYKNKKFKLYFELGELPYLMVKYSSKKDLDFVLINRLTTLFFDVYNPEGTNVIIENNIVLIIPRFSSDSISIFNDLIGSKNNSNIDINDVYEKLIQKTKDGFDEEDFEQSELKKVTEENNSEYLKINPEKLEKKEGGIKTLKKKEETLDSLLEEQLREDKNYFSTASRIEGREGDSKIEVIKEDENKEKKENDLSSISIIKGDDELKDSKKISSDEIVIEKENKIEKVPITENTKKDLINLDKPQAVEKIDEFEFYRDNLILAKINKKAPILGEIIVKFVSGKKMSEVEENDLSYILLFTKIFSSVLFETLNPHGTNILWDYNSTEIKIIPRFQNDEFKNLFLVGKQESPEFLEQIREKLLEKLNEGLSNEMGVSEQKEEVDLTQETKIKSGNDDVESKSQVSEDNEDDVDEKAEYLLESLKRIP